jgi:hypothetical protein
MNQKLRINKMYFIESTSSSPLYRKKVDFDIKQGTAKPIVKETSSYQLFDIMIRVSSESSSDIKIDIDHTHTLRSSFNDICGVFRNDIKTLADVIKSQHQLIEYNSIYSAYTLGQITEEEFIQQSEGFSYLPENVDIDKLANQLNCLIKHTGLKFSSSDLADIFQCEYEHVTKAIKKLPKNLFSLIEDRG